MSDYKSKCPKCDKEIEWNFAGNNGYVGMCGNCQRLFYYCSIFGRVDEFKSTKKRYDMNFQDLVYVK